MGTRRGHEYGELLDLTIAVLDDQITDPYHVMTGWLREALTAPAVALNDHSRDPSQCSVVAWNHQSIRTVAVDRMRRLGYVHPLARVFAAGGMSPLRISDLLDQATWKQNPNYEASRDLDGVVRQIGIPMFSTNGSFRAFIIGRPGRDFSDHELELCSRAQPLLQRLDRHLTELHRLREILSTPTPAHTDPTHHGTVRGVTPREMTVLALLAEGLTAAAIGRRLGISLATVSKHQQNMYRKLDTDDRLTTVLAAQRLGLLRRHDAEP